ncbi:MAG TPA: MFS transporter [Phnomibacter sp.]|nr:MFS transporter [Phnomibacter sp.]
MSQSTTPDANRQKRIAVSVFFFIAGFTFSSWASRIPHIQAKLGLNEAELGGVLLALPCGLFLSSLISGSVVTRLGSKNVLRLAAIAYSCMLVTLGLANHTALLVVALFFFGMAGNMFNVSVNTQAVGVERLYGRSILASFHGIWSLAGFSGASVGTVLITLGLLPWQHFIVISIVGITLSSFFVSNLIEKSTSQKASSGFKLPDKKILQLGFIAFGCLVCEGTMFDWSGVYFKKVVQVSPGLTALGYAAFMGCMATGRFLADKIVMHIGARKLLQTAGYIITTGLLVSVIFPNIIMATIGFMLVGFGVSSVVPIVYSHAGQSKTMEPGKAIAAVGTIGFTGFLSGPPLIGFVAEATNLRWSFALIALIGLSTSFLARTLPAKK